MSDMNIIVIEPSVTDRIAEMMRFRRLLSPLRIPVDVFVASEDSFLEWSAKPENILYEVAIEGRMPYEAA